MNIYTQQCTSYTEEPFVSTQRRIALKSPLPPPPPPPPPGFMLLKSRHLTSVQWSHMTGLAIPCIERCPSFFMAYLSACIFYIEAVMVISHFIHRGQERRQESLIWEVLQRICGVHKISNASKDNTSYTTCYVPLRSSVPYLLWCIAATNTAPMQ